MQDPRPTSIPQIKHDGDLAIATGRSRFEDQWKNRTITWSAFVKRCNEPVRTGETFAEYQKSAKFLRDKIKDVGGFVGGSIKQGRRKAENIANRSMITLDLDDVKKPADEVWADITLLYDFACLVYSTHSHSPESPRLRLVIPLARPVMPDEYQAVARKIAEHVGIDMFDDTTYEPHRLMYWPSVSSDGEYFFRVQDGPWLDPDTVLAQYPDWRDASYWPESSRQRARIAGQMERQEDPLTKGGIIGAFCRTYTIQEAIETFLPDIYTPTNHENRYTYAKGSTYGGVVIYENKWAYSHHATDPASGLLCNAFDLVRIHKFGTRDDETAPGAPTNRLPSYTAMMDFAAQDERVKELVSRERLAQALEEFDIDPEAAPEKTIDTSWTKKLKLNRRGELCSTIDNVLIILENDPLLKGKFAFNEFSNRIQVLGRLPWSDQVDRDWDDADDAGVRHYIESVYGITGTSKIADAVTLAIKKNRFHPVREYLESLEWDGVPRIDTLLIDYMGAADTEYVRTVTRKWMCGAVARILQPGIKFDYMLVLIGEQGIYKSTFLRLLAKDKWFTDSLQDVEGNQAVEKLLGAWIIEVAELQAFNRAESNAIKRFISSQEDRTRLAYDRRTSYLPRQCVFAGTTNRRDFLKDDTGNRRFWPVEVKREGRTKSVMRDLPKELDQIWAEAVFLWAVAGEPLYLTPEQEAVANKVRQAHREVNEKEGLIVEYLDKLLPENWDEMDLYKRRSYLEGVDVLEGRERRNMVCILEIWCECLGKNRADLKRTDSLEISAIMNNLEGWEQLSTPIYISLYGRQRVWARKEFLEQTEQRS